MTNTPDRERVPPPPQSQEEQDYDENLAEERANPDSYDYEAMADEAADRWERNMERTWP